MSKFKVTVLVVLLVVAWLTASHLEAPTPAEQVYAECNYSRTTTVSEKHCGELQDKYNIEFLCQANNTYTSNHCWTEQKDKNFQ